MTKQEAYELIEAWEQDPDGWYTCDNLCMVLNGLPDPPANREYSPEDIRQMVDDAYPPECWGAHGQLSPSLEGE